MARLLLVVAATVCAVAHLRRSGLRRRLCGNGFRGLTLRCDSVRVAVSRRALFDPGEPGEPGAGDGVRNGRAHHGPRGRTGDSGRIGTTGRPAHAGADTHRGRSAVSALAREILRIEALTEDRPEMTSVITTVRGGDSATRSAVRRRRSVRSDRAAHAESGPRAPPREPTLLGR